MRIAKHTTGPWYIDQGATAICAPNGRALINLEAIGGETEEEVQGNIKLVNAATELLKALKTLLADLTHENTDQRIRTGPHVALIRSAIAKAEGE